MKVETFNCDICRRQFANDGRQILGGLQLHGEFLQAGHSFAVVEPWEHIATNQICTHCLEGIWKLMDELAMIPTDRRDKCGHCGLPVKGYSWWTGNPSSAQSQPLHDECAKKVLFQ